MYAKRLVSLVLAGVLAACSGGSDDQIAELTDELTAERDELASQVADLEDESAGLEGRVEELESELADARSEAAAAREDEEAAAERAVQAETVADELRLRYDPEIRAGLQTAYEEEMARACTDAEARWEVPVASIVRWDPDWSPLTTEADLIAAVEECAADERSKTGAEREAERLASCERIDVDAVEKDPDAFTGVCVHMYVEIVQFDANTGRCSFRGEMSAVRSTSWLDYSGNAIFVTENDSVCPELDGIDNNDLVEVWAYGGGSLTYDTTIGGSATAVLWDIEKIELVQKG